MNFLEIKANEPVVLEMSGDRPEQVHLFDKDSIDAVNAALAARRPLLIRGEPGVGKSQLARAVAKVLKRAFIAYVVDAQAEARDLLCHFDAVQRLAEAQLGQALGADADAMKKELKVDNYLYPGPLWWAFNWTDAQTQAGEVRQSPPPQFGDCSHTNGCVLLIDEIDKAEMDLPNGLLEALGEGRFTPLGRKEPVCVSGVPPLVIITTNGERALPNAFLRRCLVLHLDLFGGELKPLDTLVKRGKAHFPELDDEKVIRPAAELLLNDRSKAEEDKRQPLPGQAEFLDLLRAVRNLADDGKGEPAEFISKVAQYIMNKQAGARV